MFLLLRQLKVQQVPCFSLTNFGDRTLKIATQNYDFLKLFDANFVSGRLKTMKPQPDIYEALEAETGYRGAELIFTDDKIENIEAAVDRGWNVHLFRSPEGWQSALQETGLLGETK